MRDVLASRSHRSYDLAVRLVCESVQAFTCAYEQGLMGTFYCLYADHIFMMTVASDMLGMQTFYELVRFVGGGFWQAVLQSGFAGFLSR